MSRYLVTGSAGFIGSHLVEELINLGNYVIGIDNFSTGSKERVILSPQYLLYERDLKFLNLENLLGNSKLDAVFHLSATVGVKNVIESPISTIINNVVSTANIVEFCRKTETPLVFTSTSEIYGMNSKLPFSENDSRLLGPADVPRWVYAESKALDEVATLELSRRFQIPSTVMRLFNTIGPSQSSAYGMVVPRFLESAVMNRPIQIYGVGIQTRAFCHVSDVVKALIASLDFGKTDGEVFNVGSTEVVTIQELAELVLELTGSTSIIEYIDPNEKYGPLFDETRHRVADTSKIEKVLGWEAKMTLRESLTDIYSKLPITR